MKIAVMLLLMICAAVTLHAQTTGTKTRSINISIGWQKFTFHDKHASPLAYNTNSIFPGAGIGFRRQTASSDFSISISGTKGSLSPVRYGTRRYETRFDDSTFFKYKVSSQFYQVSLNLEYYRKLQLISNNKLDIWVGGTLNEAGYYGDAVANMPWLFNEIDLSPSAKVFYHPYTRHSIGIKTDVAVLALVTRMPYALFPKSNHDNNVVSFLKQGTELQAVDKFQKLNWQLSYQYQVARHLAVGALYMARWIRSADPKKLAAAENNFNVTISYTY